MGLVMEVVLGWVEGEGEGGDTGGMGWDGWLLGW